MAIISYVHDSVKLRHCDVLQNPKMMLLRENWAHGVRLLLVLSVKLLPQWSQGSTLKNHMPIAPPMRETPVAVIIM